MLECLNQKRFNRLYNEYHSMVRNVLYAMTGEEALEDLTQETFIRIWNGFPRFAFKSSVETWIYRITVNTAIDYLRKRKGLNGLLTTILEENNDQNNKMVNYTELIEAALETLDEDSRSIIVLFYFEEMSIKRISRTLELPEGTVKSRLFNAKKKMKAFFAAKGVSHET